MVVHARLVAVIALLLSVACSGSAPETTRPDSRDVYAGRYALTEDLVLVVRREADSLTLLPSFWTTAQILEPVGEDSFRSLRHPQIEFDFVRGPAGAVTALVASGHRELGGAARRMGDAEVLPVENLLRGEPRAAVAALVEDDLATPHRALRLGEKLLRNFPSRADEAAAYAELLAERLPESPEVLALLGAARVRAGRRAEALAACRRALELEPDHAWARAALRHLDPRTGQQEPADARKPPFDLDTVFRPPSPDEIAAVRRDWAARDLAPRGFEQVDVQPLETPYGRFRVRIVAHAVHGSRHYGAILVPQGAGVGTCPVVVDVRGVGWDYPPRRISANLRTIEILREHATRFVLVVPSFRGEVLELGDASYRSEGDRRDAWDGATDDTIALLSVALETTPEATDRVCAYGKSRGGTVALLAAARDPRIDCVVDWAGPADWFERMGTWGWTLREQVADGLRYRWKPGEGSGSAAQFIEWHFDRLTDSGRPTLPQVRHAVLAASPLHFAETLPPSDLHYGIEDRSVPIANGIALQERLETLGPTARSHQVHLHEGTGHEMPYPRAYDVSRDFLLRHLLQTPD